MNREDDIRNMPDPDDDQGKEAIAFKSVHRIACILQYLSKGTHSITELAEKCQLHKSTVYRLLKASEKAQLTLRDPFSHKYFLGPLISDIASNPAVPHEQLLRCAISEMTGLAEYSRESVGLHVLTGYHNMFLIHEIPSTHDLQIVAKTRMHTGLHAGATSKVLISQLSTLKLNNVLTKLDYTPITPQTITSRKELEKQIKDTKRQGYAVDFSEKMEGVMCLSAPIKNYVLPAALSILAPEPRFKPRMNDCIEQILSASGSIEENLRRISST